MSQDEEHLRLLAIFHYIVAGIAAVFSLFPVIHLVLGLMLALFPEKMGGGGNPPPAFLGWIFVAFAAVFITAGLTLAGFIFTAGRCLARRRRHLLCLVVAGVECVFMPFGTALGIFTILVLSRESVKRLFEPGGSAPSAGQ